MAKASRTIKQTMHYPQQYVAWFSATQTLFNQVAAFYFEVIQAHQKVLLLSSQKALNALETLTHATEQNAHPVSDALEVVNQAENGTEDLLTDLTSIIYSFCARLYGQRRAKRKTEKIVEQLQAKEEPDAAG